MGPRTALTTALLAAFVPAMVLTSIIIAGASPIAAAIAAFGLGVAVHSAFNIWQSYAGDQRPPAAQPPAKHKANTL